MNPIEWMISEKIAKNGFNAAHIANGLRLYELKDDAAIKARCNLYRKWRNAGEAPAIAYQRAIEGKEVSSLDDYIRESNKRLAEVCGTSSDNVGVGNGEALPEAD